MLRQADRAGQGRTCRRPARAAELASAKGGDPAKAKAKGKGAGGGGCGRTAFAASSRTSRPKSGTKLRTASPEERNEILKKAGFTDDEIEQMRQMREQRRWRRRRWWRFGGGGSAAAAAVGGGGGDGRRSDQ